MQKQDVRPSNPHKHPHDVILQIKLHTDIHIYKPKHKHNQKH